MNFRDTKINDKKYHVFQHILATHLPRLGDPLLGRDPQFGKRCYMYIIAGLCIYYMYTIGGFYIYIYIAGLYIYIYIYIYIYNVHNPAIVYLYIKSLELEPSPSACYQCTEPAAPAVIVS